MVHISQEGTEVYLIAWALTGTQGVMMLFCRIMYV